MNKLPETYKIPFGKSFLEQVFPSLLLLLLKECIYDGK